MKYKTVYITDKGEFRPGNQDGILIKKACFQGQDLALMALCDGMGGMERGEVASSYVLERLSEWFEDQLPLLLREGFREELLKSQLFFLLRNCNRKLLSFGIQEGIQLGTTVTAMLFYQNFYYLVHVGDSRAYENTESRSGNGRFGDAIKLTVDQSMPENPNVLLQCVGASGQLKPDFYRGSFEAERVYMLCSDGFYHQISNRELAVALAYGQTKEEYEEQIEKLVGLSRDRREKDNASAVILYVEM